MKKLFTFLLIVNTFMVVYGQNADNKWALGLFGGKTEYNGDFGNGLFKFDKAFYGFAGLSFDRYLCKSFDLGIQGTSGSYGIYRESKYDNKITKIVPPGYNHNTNFNFSGNKMDLDLLLRYKLNNGYIFKEKCLLSPFIAVGAGVSLYSGDYIYNEEDMDILIPVGGGIKINFLENVALQYQFLYNFTTYDKRDYYNSEYNDNFASHNLGLVFSFGSPRDSDRDGVKDDLDKCPNTPKGVKVDADGCPIDADKDGVADYLDKCPLIAGVAAFNGCPDSDGDGIVDSLDKCPAVAGLAAFNGCPDTDGDGITDADDKCPNVKGLLSFNGCPDTDEDGITDADDRCPNAKGAKALQGCPDKDNDGVADIDDKCPDVPGIVENRGCPEIKAETKKVFEQALKGIQFETGKDIIKPVSFPILNKVVNVMKENPVYNLDINGHTDSQGNADKNLTLSQKRADAVKKFLVDKGIDPTRMKAMGFGQTQAVADNATADGRAKNRRVEFKVIF